MAGPETREGRSVATPRILAWVEALHAPHDAALRTAAEASERFGVPPIHLAASEGRLLHLLLRLIGARKVVEVGTLAGYSALWMARALPEDGRLWTLEADYAHAEIARSVLRDAGLQGRVEVLHGKALETLPHIVPFGPFDAVFLDADKAGYLEYGRWAARHLRPGGLLLADNVFLFGRLLEEGDPEAEAMRRFHREAAERFETVCVPTPEGLLIGLRR